MILQILAIIGIIMTILVVIVDTFFIDIKDIYISTTVIIMVIYSVGFELSRLIEELK